MADLQTRLFKEMHECIFHISQNALRSGADVKSYLFFSLNAVFFCSILLFFVVLRGVDIGVVEKKKL